MAKRRRKTSSGTRIVRVGAPRAASPIIRVQAPRAAPVRRHARRLRKAATTLGLGGPLGYALGGWMFGMLVKSGLVAKLPAIPVIGRTGTAAIGLHYLSKHGGGELARKGAIAAATLAGYQLGSTGSIVGDGMDGLQTTGDGYEASGDEG